MNNNFLEGILGGQISPVQALQTGKKQSNPEIGDFMSLLQNRLAFDADSSSDTSSSNTHFSFRANSGAGDLNPLLIGSSETRFLSERKPVFEKKSEGYQENNAWSKSLAKKTDEYSRKKTETEKEITDADASESAKTAQLVSGTSKVASDENADLRTIESLLENFNPQEQTALINALQRMSPEDLQALAESPDDFQNNLLELINNLPESDGKSSLQDLVTSPEFMNLLTAVSDQLQANLATAGSEAMQTSTDSSEQQLNGISAAQMSLVDSEDAEAAKNSDSELDASDEGISDEQLALNLALLQSAEAKKTAAENSVNTNINSLEGENGIEQASVVTSEDSSSKGNDADKESEMAALKKDAKTQDKSSVEEEKEDSSKNAEISGNQVNKETLRQEFKRLNDAGNTAEATVDTNSSDSDETTARTSQNHVAANQETGTSEVKPAIEEAAKRFLSLLGEKASSSTGKSESHAFSAVTVESGKKSTHSAASSNNSGMNNGYSFQSGNTANANAATKGANLPPVATTAFAELLNKAEFVKLKNGSKVLNLELDPKELGKVQMELTSKDGTVTARISAESTMAKAKLDELAPQIKEQLISQGVNLTEITVDISSRNPDERSENQMSGGKSKSNRITASRKDDAEAIIQKNVLPNLRRAALNIQAVDMTV